MGTPACVARSLAVCFSPKDSILSGLGPTQTMPAPATALAKSAFSDKKPYPGMMASALFSLAILMISSLAEEQYDQRWIL